MLKAGAVLYAIFISFLIACLCSIFILLFYINSNVFNSLLNQYTVSDNLNSAVNYILSTDESFPAGQETKIHLFDEIISDVSIKKTYWGVYEKYFIQQDSYPEIKRVALIGKTNKSIFPAALFLTNKNEYLKLGGNSRIKGDSYLPGASVKYVNTDGTNLTNSQSVSGNIYKSGRGMPPVNLEFIQYVEKFLNFNFSADNQNYRYVNSSEIKNLGTNSFENATIIVKAKDVLTLDKVSLDGNIIIWSPGKVVITSNANLNNILIFAEEAFVESGFNGRLQIFTRGNIEVDRNCYFKYPSILLSRGNNVKVIINEGSEISGGVFITNNNIQSNDRSTIYIKPDARIYGEIISYGYVCHEGILYGTMMTNGIFSESGSALLENTMINGVIDVTEMPLFLVRSMVIDQHKSKEIIDML